MSEPTEGAGGRRSGNLIDQVKSMTPAERSALRQILSGGGGGASAAGGTPKFSTALEAVAPEEADSVLAALVEGIEASQDGGDPVAPLDAVHPDLARAARENSTYRRKPTLHSIEVAKRWIEENHYHDPDADDPGDADAETSAEDGAAPRPARRKRRKGKR